MRASKSSRKRKSRRPSPYRLRLEPLEKRTLLATFAVNSTDDTSDANPGDGLCLTSFSGGVCTLRAAIQEANVFDDGGTDNINFAIPATDPRHFYYIDDNTANPGQTNNTVTRFDQGGQLALGTTTETDDANIPTSGASAIDPDWKHSFYSIEVTTNQLPAITEAVIINGFSQTGASANTKPISMSSDAVLRVEVVQKTGLELDGLVVTGGTGSTIKGLAVHGFGFVNRTNGIVLRSAGNTVEGSNLGGDVSGLDGIGNQGYGVLIDNAANNVIGGTAEAARVIAQGNRAGITIQGTGATGNMVQGGLLRFHPNLAGVVIADGASQNTVGGTVPGAANVIGNNQQGVWITGLDPNTFLPTADAANNNKVQGNFIGTDPSGADDFPNNTNILINIEANNNLIGGLTTTPGSGAGNVISGGQYGVSIVQSTGTTIQGNLIGTKPGGTAALGSFFSGVIDQGGTGTTIGGADVQACNVISASNFRAGIDLQADGALIQSNYIGTDITGLLPLGNFGGGINIRGSNNLITENVIAFNKRLNDEGFEYGGGVTVFSGTGNSILSNSIHNNEGLGIELVDEDGPDGLPLPNDGSPPCNAGQLDCDEGANRLQNFPVITEAKTDGTTLTLTYSVPSSPGNSIYPLLVEFFKADSDGEEGQTLLGSSIYTSNGSSTTIAFIPLVPLVAGDKIVATATDSQNAVVADFIGPQAVLPNFQPSNTSEFTSPSFTVTSSVCSLIVNTTSDVLNAGDSVNSLREAIICANVTPGPDTITVPAGTYTLTITGTGEDAAATGDLDITDALTLNGASAATTIIQAGTSGAPNSNGIDRVFQVLSLGNVTLNNLTIRNGNAGTSPGGGILNEINANARLTIQDSVITTNSADKGAGIYHTGSGSLTLLRTTISDNMAGKGAGILNNSGAVDITDSTIAGNIAVQQGGGIINTGSTMSLTRSTVSGNTAGTDGGGIFNRVALTMINSTISGNKANGSGGGINNSGSGSVSLSYVTVTNNTADQDNNGSGDGGGAADSTETGFQAGNTIIGGNFDRGGQSPDFAGILSSQGFNLIGSTAGTTITGTTTGNILGQAPLLDPLANNGGFTATHALQANSPALNAANPNSFPPTDQRSVTRPQNGRSDIGAFESSDALTDLQVTKTNSVNGTTTLGSNWMWTVHVSSSNAPATFASGQTILLDNLPNANITYGTVTVANQTNIAGSGTISCSINASSDLTCVASGGPVTLGQASFSGNPFTLVANGPNTAQLFGLTSDAQGKVYIGNNSNTTTGIPLQVFDPALFTGTPIALASFGPAVGDADGLAFGGGFVFSGDANEGLRRTAVSGAASSILVAGTAINGTGSPVVVRPSDGNVFVGFGATVPGAPGDNRIDEYDAAGTFVQTFDTVGETETMTFDPISGLIYYAPFGTEVRSFNPVTKVDAHVGNSTGTIDGALAFDPITGLLFVGTANGVNSGRVETIDPATGTTNPFASGFNGSLGILREPVTGDLYFLETNRLFRLASSQFSTGSFDVQFTATPLAEGTFTNPRSGSTTVCQVDPSSAVLETNEQNNTCQDSVTVQPVPPADLQIEKTDGQTEAVPGQTVTYTITVRNNGPSNAPGTKVADMFPATLTNVTFTAAGAGNASGFRNGSGNINQTVNLPAGGAIVYTVKGTVSPAATGTLENTATVTAPAGITDNNPNNNSAKDTDTLTPQSDLRLSKTDSPDRVPPGGNLTYTLTVTSTGPSDAQNVTLSDPLPLGTTFVSASQSSSGPQFNLSTPPVGQTGTFSATIGTFPAGSTAVFTLVVHVSSDTPLGTIIDNSATVSAATSDPNSENNSATATSTVAIGLPACDVGTLNVPGRLGTAVIREDADHPGSSVLLITGTRSSDVIVVEASPDAFGMFQVVGNKRVIVTFISTEVSRIVAFGLEGQDKIVVSPLLTQPAKLFGGPGNDTLVGGWGPNAISGGNGNDNIVGGIDNDSLCGDNGNDVIDGSLGDDTIFGDAGNDVLAGSLGDDLIIAGGGNDVAVGGPGDDELFGQQGNDKLVDEIGNDILVGGMGLDKLIAGVGRDLLIGGGGADKLFGLTESDILVADATDHDESIEALEAILAEWTSDNSYDDRVDNLKTGGGANGAFVLNATTVRDDNAIDWLYGDGDFDWFLTGRKDKIKDRTAGERVN